MNDTPQLLIIHLSDIHFGGRHRFSAPATPAGDVPDDAYPTLLKKLVADVAGEDPGCPVLIAVTGDVAETGSYDEFKKAKEFLSHLAEAVVYGRARGIGSIFVVPGNHDVLFTCSDIGERWQQWTDFHNDLYKASVDRAKPRDFARVHDCLDELGAIVVCVNSSMYVEQGKSDQDRGRVDMDQLLRLEEELEQIDRLRLDSAIRVALIHHHPVLIPALAEPNRGYDAVLNSAQLLRILRQFGFHVILHGHKHNPYIFTEDSSSAYQSGEQRPILIVAGGSVGSTSLPSIPGCLNTYNRIMIKWHPRASQARIQVVTRGLCVFNQDRTERLPGKWEWETLKRDDRYFIAGERAPVAGGMAVRGFVDASDGVFQEERIAEYRRLRGNFPVVEVMPSLVPGQAYEARVWIVHHRGSVPDDVPEEWPVRVIWSAGRRFPVAEVDREQDPNFCAAFNYWGAMLIQARMEFADGGREQAHVYARLPS